jgi:hypothetical protein
MLRGQQKDNAERDPADARNPQPPCNIGSPQPVYDVPQRTSTDSAQPIASLNDLRNGMDLDQGIEWSLDDCCSEDGQE